VITLTDASAREKLMSSWCLRYTEVIKKDKPLKAAALEQSHDVAQQPGEQGLGLCAEQLPGSFHGFATGQRCSLCLDQLPHRKDSFRGL